MPPPHLLPKRPSVHLSISTTAVPTTASTSDSRLSSPTGWSPLVSPSFQPPPSAPSTPGTTTEFARNLANTRAFSQNTRRMRRHASLDLGPTGGVRSRMGSLYGPPMSSAHDQLGSPMTAASFYSSDSGGMDEKGRLLSADMPASPLYSPFFFQQLKRKPWYEDRKNVALATAAAFALFVFGGIVGFSLLSRPGAGDLWGVKSVLEDYGVPFKHSTCENPYAEFGRVHVDLSRPENNRWLPYDPTCVPPALMADLRSALNHTANLDAPLHLPLPAKRPSRDPSLPLPWLYGKTVLLFGDHVERNHNKDFCRFAGGKFASIGRDHALSPPRFVNGIDEKLSGANQENHEGTRPAVCYIEEYDFMILSVFHFGLANRVEFEHESLLYDPHFYPPVAVDDRLTHIVLPLLDSLNRPHPDLIEFSSGFWDLRHFAALDELTGTDPYGELSTERLAWYSGRLTHALADLGAVFPNTPLLWRTLHHTPKFNQTSPARVAALDQLSRKVVGALNEARNRAEARHRIELLVQQPGGSRDTYLNERLQAEAAASSGSRWGRKKTTAGRKSSKAPFLNRVNQRIGSSDRMKDVVLGNDETSLKGLIQVDEWGALMRGQEHTMNNVFTPALPGGYIWGDIILAELRRVIFSSHHRS
ncbi:hypothetical protein JCM6882_004218 [Rhodosporidiobolus microsporus]